MHLNLKFLKARVTISNKNIIAYNLGNFLLVNLTIEKPSMKNVSTFQYQFHKNMFNFIPQDLLFCR